ncbi:MAG TPA: hypothetical protein VJJ78_04655 [Candidatus Saccharimonadales bacterium]|nr:hypothetical protein [Candidatus Saccharimonadales bacterium]
MSVELPGADEDIFMAAGEVGYKSGRVLRAEGLPVDESQTVGRRGGEIGAKLTMLAFKRMGILPQTFDHSAFDLALTQIEFESGVADEIYEHQRSER